MPAPQWTSALSAEYSTSLEGDTETPGREPSDLEREKGGDEGGAGGAVRGGGQGGRRGGAGAGGGGRRGGSGG